MLWSSIDQIPEKLINKKLLRKDGVKLNFKPMFYNILTLTPVSGILLIVISQLPTDMVRGEMATPNLEVPTLANRTEKFQYQFHWQKFD